MSTDNKFLKAADEYARERVMGDAIKEELKITQKVVTVLTERLGGKVFIGDEEIEWSPSLRAWRDESRSGVFLVTGDEADDLIDEETTQE